MLFTVKLTIESVSTSSTYSLSMKSISLLSFSLVFFLAKKDCDEDVPDKLPIKIPKAKMPPISMGKYLLSNFIFSNLSVIIILLLLDHGKKEKFLLLAPIAVEILISRG